MFVLLCSYDTVVPGQFRGRGRGTKYNLLRDQSLYFIFFTTNDFWLVECFLIPRFVVFRIFEMIAMFLGRGRGGRGGRGRGAGGNRGRGGNRPTSGNNNNNNNAAAAPAAQTTSAPTTADSRDNPAGRGRGGNRGGRGKLSRKEIAIGCFWCWNLAEMVLFIFVRIL